MELTALGDGGGTVALVASFTSGGGTPAADVMAIAISVAVFALLYWAIDLIDRI